MMANEDLIYRITRTVYDRLGADADEQAVEQLVTEIYRQVEPFLSTNGTSYSSRQNLPASGSVTSPSHEGSPDRLIISVFGVDHPGIVAGVAQILAEADCSIVDINQTVVQGKFAMVIVGDASSRSPKHERVERATASGRREAWRTHLRATRRPLQRDAPNIRLPISDCKCRLKFFVAAEAGLFRHRRCSRTDSSSRNAPIGNWQSAMTNSFYGRNQKLLVVVVRVGHRSVSGVCFALNAESPLPGQSSDSSNHEPAADTEEVFLAPETVSVDLPSLPTSDFSNDYPFRAAETVPLTPSHMMLRVLACAATGTRGDCSRCHPLVPHHSAARSIEESARPRAARELVGGRGKEGVW